jgi:6-phosphogluconolactonase
MTRRTFLSASAATLAATKLHAAPATAKTLYVASSAKGPSAGLYASTWNPATATLSSLRLVAPLEGGSFFAVGIQAGKRRIFSGHQSAPKVGALSSYEAAPNGDLALITTITVPEFDFVHIVLDHTEGCLVTASYGTAKVMSVKIAPDGQLSVPVSQFNITGSGPHPTRQTASHPHGVCFSPDNKFVFINDLGTDRIMIYQFNAATAKLTPHSTPYFQGAAGSGPRHLAFHPDGKWAYSVNELDSTLTQLAWNAAKGTFTLVSTTSTLLHREDVAGARAGEVIFDASGRTLYSCNRGSLDELVTCSIAPATGRITVIQRLPLEAKEARHYTLTPDGSSLLVAEQFSDRVAIFARDSKDGTLKTTPNSYPVTTPTCVLFT